MKFLALISGGKDSFYNIHHCLTQGHELVALGNLYPENTEQDEIDSFMFQTVGHDIINYYSQCLDVPLYRQAIKGGSKNQALEYTKTEDDEIEDLSQLIETIVSKHPDVEAVSCGAILSQYQRTRVENICDRFGLTSLAFLWQRDQDQLMREMCASELDARIIKVAAVGLDSKHLGKSITELYPFLVKLNEMYEVHVCGEGGEFETIVLDCKFFNKKKLEMTESAVVEVPGDVYYLKFKVKVVDKNANEFEPVAVPGLLRDNFQEIADNVDADSAIAKVIEDSNEQFQTVIQPCVNNVANNLYISNLVDFSGSIQQQLKNIFNKLEERLDLANLTFNDIQHIALLVSDMSRFAEINSVYQERFEGLFLPPSRVCVEAQLTPGLLIQLSCKCILKEINVKKGVHIRSRSYWAPQNIGPYSQARVEEQMSYNLATISGQIPLIPSSMELVVDDVQATLLTIQHFESIKTIINVKDVSYMLCFITSKVNITLLQELWEEYCEYEDFSNKLIILKVNRLPRNATIEIGGETYRKFMDYDQEEEEEERLEKNTMISSLKESYPDMILTSLVDTVQVIIFTNFSDKLEDLFNLDCHIRVYTNDEYVRKIKDKAFEYFPVSSVHDAKLKAFDYCLILTFEI